MNTHSLLDLLSQRFVTAIADATGLPPERIEPQVRAAGDPKFGDYQCNAAMALAKEAKAKPRELAEKIKHVFEKNLAADKLDWCEPLEIAGPGFLNIRLKPEFLARHLSAIPASATDAQPDRLGLPPVEKPQKIVVDYSQPNIAKQMHVGHLRSTIIGDVFVRTLGFLGHEVIRQNHIGDWGTQFGMLIEYYRAHPVPTPATSDDVLAAMESDYRAAQEQFKSDENFATAARQAVVRLQSGDPAARKVWEQLCAESHKAFTEIYERLGVLLQPDDVRGESFYNDRLTPVVAELREKLPPRDAAAQIAQKQSWAEVRDDQGAVCVFLYDEKGESRFKDAEGKPLPLIIQKSDGGYLYATTDLAAVRYRIKELGARRILYVVDARQKLHFDMFFAVARAVGWAGPDVALEHVRFGSVLGTDRKPLKTREGKNIKLRELLDEAENRAYELLQQKAAEAAARDKAEPAGGEEAEPPAVLPETEQHDIAQRVGIAAVKYADLSRDRNGDYVFSWDTMLAMQGNTAPYMMYAYARIRSIYRKAAERTGSPDVYAPAVHLKFGQSAERALALRLSRFSETVDAVAAELLPHVLCNYLYELAGDFMRFYEACPVLQAPDDATRLGRLRLCDLTARTLRLGLGLLGIEVLERM